MAEFGLIGVVPLRTLIMAQPEATIEDIMTEGIGVCACFSRSGRVGGNGFSL